MLFFRAEGVSQQWQPSIWAIVQAEGTMLSEWREELEEESRGREGGTDEENNSRRGHQEGERQEEQDCEERGERTEIDSESEAQPIFETHLKMTARARAIYLKYQQITASNAKFRRRFRRRVDFVKLLVSMPTP